MIIPLENLRIHPCLYGAGREGVSRALALALQMARQQGPAGPSLSDCSATLTTHFGGLLGVARDTAISRVKVIRDLEAVSSFPGSGEDWGAAFPSGEWSASLGQTLGGRVEIFLREGGDRSLFGPPLWPSPGLENVVQPLLFSEADPALLARIQSLGPGWWRLVRSIEQNLRNALVWCVAARKGDRAEVGPFEVLLQLHASGVVPMGLDGSEAIVYSGNVFGQCP